MLGIDRLRVQRLLRRAVPLAAFALLPLAVLAATPVEPPRAQVVLDALTRANDAVVGIEVLAAEGARSAESLGQRRAGTGVVIGPEGLILTIGYLILEADQVSVVTQDRKVIPARAVAYDLATGFGLVRPLLPLRGIEPVPLGSLQGVEAGDAMMSAMGAQQDTDGDVAMTQLVSKRPFSGYWEYHIDSALFTSPPVGNHSGAPLFNQ
ncbi:MAG: serine protease, partial [Lysobacteraceae bacterium]